MRKGRHRLLTHYGLRITDYALPLLPNRARIGFVYDLHGAEAVVAGDAGRGFPAEHGGEVPELFHEAVAFRQWRFGPGVVSLQAVAGLAVVVVDHGCPELAVDLDHVGGPRGHPARLDDANRALGALEDHRDAVL